ncbi:MAG TPA: mechanosensitive ion channel domain-containing protein [Polyangiaceae bacterium]
MQPGAKGVLALVCVILACLALQAVVRRVLARTVDDGSTRLQANKAVGYGLWLLAIVVLVKTWLPGDGSGMATYLGLLSAGVAIALQAPVTNLVAWIYIVLRRPFGIGSRIQIGRLTGDVVDIRPFRFLVLEVGNWVRDEQSTGRVVRVPNSFVFSSTIANYDDAFGYVWNEIEVIVTAESNWRSAKTALEKILLEHAEKLAPDVTTRIRLASESMHIRLGKLTPVVWTSMVDSGVCLTMRYLCKPRERRSSQSVMLESVLDVVGAMPDVDLAYPTVRVLHRPGERPRSTGIAS